MNHLTAAAIGPDRDQLAALLAQAEQAVIAQRRSYGTERDEDTAWRCAWNTWRTLQELIPAVRVLIEQPPTPPAAPAARHLQAVPVRAAA
jgi:hypothetical protein